MLGFEKLEGDRLRAMILLCGGLCFSLFGYDQGVVGGIIGEEGYLHSINDPNGTIQGVVTAIYNIGCMIGCAIAAVYGLAIGRRMSLFAGCIIVIVGGIGQSASYSMAQTIVFRIITGVGTGMISSTVPVWVSEIAPPQKRGQAVAIELAIVLSGNVTAYWIDYGMSFVDTDASFRFPLAFQCFYPLVAAVLVLGLPESPRTLYYWGRTSDADSVLCRLHCVHSSIEESSTAAAEKQAILDAIVFDQDATSTESIWKAIFWDESPIRNSRRVFIIVVMQILQQLGGCNVVTYYQAKLFSESVGLSTETSKLVAGCSAIVFWIGTWQAIWAIELIGRRRLLLLGSLGTLTSMLAFMILLATGHGSQSTGWAAVAMIFLYEFIFGASWNTTVWAYAPEISPLRFRHINTSLGVGAEWLFTFVTVMMAPTAIENTGWKIYLLFVVFNFLQIPFVYFLCPETKGKSLEDLDKLFMKNGVSDVITRSEESIHVDEIAANQTTKN